MLYIGIFAVLLLLRVTVGQLPQVVRPVYFLVLLFLFLFVAFRFQVGCDWTGYFYQFSYNTVYFQFHGVSTISEPLWWAIIDLLLNADLDYRWLNVVAAAIFFGGVHVLARRQPDPLTFLIVLFPVLIINMPMSGIRQGAAVGVMCIAFAAFIDKRTTAYVLWTILATTLHSSAIAFLLLAPMVRGAVTKERVLLTVLLAIPGLFVLMSTDSAELAISRYFDTGVDASGASYRIAFLALSGLLYVMFLRRKWLQEYPADYKLTTIGSAAMILLVLLLPLSTVIGDRMGYYLVPIQGMIFARVPYLSLGRARIAYGLGIYAGLTLLFVSWAVLSDHFELCYVPYKNWLLDDVGYQGLPPG